MKSNEEFIAGIYRKAEAQKASMNRIEIEQAEAATMTGWQGLQTWKERFQENSWRYARRGTVMLAAAAACLVLVVQSGKMMPDAPVGTENYGISTASVGEEISTPAVGEEPVMQVRTMEPEGSYRVEAELVEVEDVAALTEEAVEESAEVVLHYQVKETGEELVLTLTAEELALYYPNGVQEGTLQRLLLTEEEELRLLGVEPVE